MESSSLFRWFRTARARGLKRYAQRRLARKDFTIISDDCWGARIYSEFGLKCHSPFIGMGFTAHEYLDFLCGFREAGALEILGEKTDADGHPLLQTRNAWLYGLHFRTAQEFRHAFERRRKMILWDRVFIKIDFGKTKYRPEDIVRWNELKFPNSVALYPNKAKFLQVPIHHGVMVPDWVLNGNKQFGISCRRFDIFDWLNHGRVGWSAAYCWRQLLFMERDFAGHIGWFLRRSLRSIARLKRKAFTRA